MAWRSGLAYPQDLRERVLAAVDAGLAVRKVASLFKVSISYTYKALERRAATDDVAPQHGAGSRPPKPAGHEAA
ncbi:IS630 transposase-related protein [Siccirubricoccus sp. KC 17139]|uniref:IS630 transposase-related protein n=1 Tax=Siccirubricoccus soli TaxID=2899147 RepID=A0ABT1D5F4_9PROT|nr:transposase [Siccirubricoccus soli]MCO6416530.1 IS630 transposase-related protein [Siccirubricoccus soli]MCP2682664.1 transposase [Siccirubricoccus soli]